MREKREERNKEERGERNMEMEMVRDNSGRAGESRGGKNHGKLRPLLSKSSYVLFYTTKSRSYA